MPFSMPELKSKDLIAIITIVGIVILKLTGHDGALDTAAALILGYYFVKRENGHDNGK